MAIDPEYAAAYAGMANSWMLLGYFFGMPPREAFQKVSKQGPSLIAQHVGNRRRDYTSETKEIKPKILSEVGPQLDRTELEVRKSNRPGWWYDAEYERWEMTPHLIREDSSYGVWELTEDGRWKAERLKFG